MTDQASDPAARLAQVRRRIEKAALAAGRRAGDITLTAVSKQQPWERIEPVLAAGQRVFGENRVQEAMERWSGRRDTAADLELRLIGPLQSNKAREAVAFFDVIETVDREKIARTLAEEIARSGKAPRLYVQVNTGEEPQKAGVAPRDADAFLRLCREDCGLTVEGLMCIPPAEEEPAMHFALLARIAARNGLERLSMGMSDDYETAVRFGATSVRVGSALFGGR
ncbi:MAG TPA: YggS family pyridoxal phosphate-dependent enzyme [Caulobacteraceae bacterium]|nr:YggS family pyridoxal phosphate-dependent enzyme [Caulobacteraceae bacterium]